MMTKDEDSVAIKLWDRVIGAATWDEDRRLAVFQYDPEFVGSGIQIAPIRMPLRKAPYDFPALANATFRGLPGLLEDSLPDKYGNSVLDRWYTSEGRIADQIHSISRLRTIGRSGMGALEFYPEDKLPVPGAGSFDIETAYVLANQVFDGVDIDAAGQPRSQSLTLEMLVPGMFAGGAKPKAIVLWHPEEGYSLDPEDTAQGFEHWLIKFDASRPPRGGAPTNGDGQYGIIEYAYYKLARKAGIIMTPCRMEEIGGRRHFMTKRFDRTPKGGKLLMQSLGALAHFDYNRPGAYSYEQCLQVMRRLDLPAVDFEQQVLRAVFNVLTRNQDDHVKNIAFLMDKRGHWRLAPAFDMTFAYNKQSVWTGTHQMTLSNKRDGFERDDLMALARQAGIKTVQAKRLIGQVCEALGGWAQIAAEVSLDDTIARHIQAQFRPIC